MCITEFNQDVYEKGLLQEGREEGRMETFFQLVQEGICPIDIAADKLGLSVQEFSNNMYEADYKIPELI